MTTSVLPPQPVVKQKIHYEIDHVSRLNIRAISARSGGPPGVFAGPPRGHALDTSGRLGARALSMRESEDFCGFDTIQSWDASPECPLRVYARAERFRTIQILPKD